jgi:hypothetical protein
MADDVRSQSVSLGCGTLILIALIVLIVGGRGQKEIEQQVEGLRTEIGELRTEIESQSQQIERLVQSLEATRAGAESDDAPGDAPN